MRPACPTRRALSLASAACFCAFLAGCTSKAPGSGAPPLGELGQVATPPAPAEPPPPVEQPLVKFYSDVETDLTSSGRMRRETAPKDAPFDLDDLVRNFERIALYDEYVDRGGRFVRSETPGVLRRWNRPVRVGVMTGNSVPPKEAARDRANVAGFTSRLAGLTGLDMKVVQDTNINFLVLFMNSDESITFAEQAADKYPEFAPSVMAAIRDASVETFCTAYAFSDPGNRAVYSAVIILIRAEHPPLTRLSCVHEEMAQAMGLPNDSPEARPSLFNDSLEFALLTVHDEILLRMLYDPRLKPGMTREQAAPLLPEIAQDAWNAHRRSRGKGANTN